MNKIFKKSIPVILLAAFLLIAGGFCNSLIASASVPKQEVAVAVTHPVDCTQENKQVEKAKPINKTLLPCCLERKNNSDITVPASSQYRINFSQAMMTNQVALVDNAIDQKIYSSSPSPPPEDENISCTVKIE